ncbi:MAG: hypothetical protein KDE14_07375 [Rhodobacteraceae bacterium]|nr:hypothetical protein [Paracoccaceae bacterium]
MFRLRIQAGAAESTWRINELDAKADIAEARVLHKPQASYGVQILDKAHESGLGSWAIVPAFYLFTLLDFLSGMVRPAAAYAAFSFYVIYKMAQFEVLTGTRFEASAAEAIVQLWSEQDWNVLVLILSYWFGARSAKLAFGGKSR